MEKQHPHTCPARAVCGAAAVILPPLRVAEPLGRPPAPCPLPELPHTPSPPAGRDPPSQSRSPPALTGGEGAAQKAEASSALPGRPPSAPRRPLPPRSALSAGAAPSRAAGERGARLGAGRGAGRGRPGRRRQPRPRGVPLPGGGWGGSGEGPVPPRAHAALPGSPRGAEASSRRCGKPQRLEKAAGPAWGWGLAPLRGLPAAPGLLRGSLHKAQSQSCTHRPGLPSLPPSSPGRLGALLSAEHKSF